MKLKRTLFSLFSLTLLAFGGWLTILFNVDPLKSETFVFIALYASLFLFLTGILTFAGFWLRILFSNREVIYAQFPQSLRQAMLLSFALVGLLFLQSLRVLSAIDAGAFILAILLIELFFRSKPKAETQKTGEEL